MSKYKTKNIKVGNKYRKITTYCDNIVKDNDRILLDKTNMLCLSSKYAYAYKKNTTIYDALVPHLKNNSNYFFQFDLKSFFNSVTDEMVLKELNKLKMDASLKNEIKAYIDALKEDGFDYIPQGLVLSPMLSNVALNKYDRELYSKLRKLKGHRIIYTRYSDDILISLYCNGKVNKEIDKKISNIVVQTTKKHKLKLNYKKVRINLLDSKNYIKFLGCVLVDDNGITKAKVSRSFNKRLNKAKKENCQKKYKGMLNHKNEVIKLNNIKKNNKQRQLNEEA